VFSRTLIIKLTRPFQTGREKVLCVEKYGREKCRRDHRPRLFLCEKNNLLRIYCPPRYSHRCARKHETTSFKNKKNMSREKKVSLERTESGLLTRKKKIPSSKERGKDSERWIAQTRGLAPKRWYRHSGFATYK